MTYCRPELPCCHHSRHSINSFATAMGKYANRSGYLWSIRVKAAEKHSHHLPLDSRVWIAVYFLFRFLKGQEDTGSKKQVNDEHRVGCPAINEAWLRRSSSQSFFLCFPVVSWSMSFSHYGLSPSILYVIRTYYGAFFACACEIPFQSMMHPFLSSFINSLLGAFIHVPMHPLIHVFIHLHRSNFCDRTFRAKPWRTNVFVTILIHAFPGWICLFIEMFWSDGPSATMFLAQWTGWLAGAWNGRRVWNWPFLSDPSPPILKGVSPCSCLISLIFYLAASTPVLLK